MGKDGFFIIKKIKNKEYNIVGIGKTAKEVIRVSYVGRMAINIMENGKMTYQASVKYNS